jgi:integrase
MAGRPPLAIGTHGKIPPPKEVSPGLWEAFCRYRDADGVTRRVARRGKSRGAATAALQLALTQRRAGGNSTLRGESRVSEAAELVLAQWQAKTAAGDMAPRTLAAYEEALRLHVLPTLGKVRLREATTGRCEDWLVALRKTRGPVTCRRARTVLSAVLGYAARMEALAANPVPGLSPIVGQRKRVPRAMTRDERDAWLAWMDSHVASDPSKTRRPELAHPPEGVIAGQALGDVTRFMLGTGCRIGETMAVSWDEVDFDARTVAIRWHLVRVKGEGLVRMPGAKSEAGDRVLGLPRWCVDMLLRRRIAGSGAYPVFPDALGGWRDPNLVMRWLRWSRDAAGFSWVTSHVFRQTVLTTLDGSGELSPREMADHAGHSRVEQTHAYMQRGMASPRAADVLEQML